MVGGQEVKALLFSGGVESTCLAYMYKPDIALTIDYGQVSAAGEIRCASHLAQLLGLSHEVIKAPLAHLGSGELAGKAQASSTRPPDHWPFRNQLLITLAAMSLAAGPFEEILIGTVSGDRVHGDGTRQFLSSMNEVLHAQNEALRLSAPAADLTTSELVRRSGVSLQLLRWTFSCHRGPIACGKCRGCTKTLELFEELNSKEA